MKLYKLFEEVILEEKRLITETANGDEIIKAITSSKAVKFQYRDEETGELTNRYCLLTVYGQLFNDNFAVRAQQISGGSKRGNNNAATKLLRVDRIENFKMTNMVIRVPVEKYNPNGDKKYDLASRKVVDSFKRIIAQAEPITSKNTQAQPTAQPTAQQPVEPQVEPQVNPEENGLDNDLKK